MPSEKTYTIPEIKNRIAEVSGYSQSGYEYEMACMLSQLLSERDEHGIGYADSVTRDG